MIERTEDAWRRQVQDEEGGAVPQGTREVRAGEPVEIIPLTPID